MPFIPRSKTNLLNTIFTKINIVFRVRDKIAKKNFESRQQQKEKTEIRFSTSAALEHTIRFAFRGRSLVGSQFSIQISCLLRPGPAMSIYTQHWEGIVKYCCVCIVKPISNLSGGGGFKYSKSFYFVPFNVEMKCDTAERVPCLT